MVTFHSAIRRFMLLSISFAFCVTFSPFVAGGESTPGATLAVETPGLSPGLPGGSHLAAQNPKDVSQIGNDMVASGSQTLVPSTPEGQAVGSYRGRVAPLPEGPEPVVVPLGGPANDDCVNAQAIAIPSTTPGTTVGASLEAPPVAACGAAGNQVSPGVWYTFTGTGTILRLSTCAADGGSASYNTKISVYCQNCPGICVAGNNDGPAASCPGFQSRLDVCTQAGQTYRVLVHGATPPAVGNFALRAQDLGLACTPTVSCLPVFPPAGTDLSPTTGIFHVDATGIGPVQTSVAGQTLLQWQNPVTGPTGQRTVQTEMLSMDLSGSNPSLGSLNIRAGSLHGLPPTLGSVTQLGPGSDFPALATFDVFFEVEVLGVATLRNSEPLVMQADITQIPPRAVGLRNVSPILITDIVNPAHVDVLRRAQHWMCPPPFPPRGVPCPVPCDRSPFPVCSPGDCPGTCSVSGATCRVNADCPPPQTCVGVEQCVPNNATDLCECRPGFPPAGTDLSPTVGTLRVDVIGVGPVDPSVSGQTLLQWQNPVTGPGGERTVQTEMLSLELTGSHPSIGNLHVTAGSQHLPTPTLGSVVPLGPGSDFPALATFDVFFEVEVQGVATLRNSEPLVMQADITEIPPRSIGLRNSAPVQIIDIVNPQHIDTIQTAQHWMCPPPFPPPGVPCPVPCDRNPFPVCGAGSCPTPTQQCVAVPNSSSGGTTPDGRCTCVSPFPPAGTDLSPTVGTLRVDVIGVGPVEPTVSGQTLLQWQNPVTGPGGERTVQTEMLSLELTGSHPSIGNLHVTAGSQHLPTPTLGSVVPLGPGSDFPALATFDVFFEVEVQGVATLRNSEPLVMQADITEIPPRAVGLRNAAPVQIIDIVNPQHIDTIQTAQHWMCPPPFPPPGVPCPVPCDRNPFPVCRNGSCPPDLPLCVPDAAAQACRCVSPFPPHGFDLSPTTGIFRVDVFGVGETDAQVSGEVLLRWQDPVTGPGGERTVQTEMLSLDLSGSNPSIGNLHVTGGTNHGLPATLGSVTPIDPGFDFPALATFDVFFEVEVPGVATLRNDQPLVMQAEITEIPPRSISLRNAAPVPLRNLLDPQQPNTIQTAAHWMCPPPFPPPDVPCPVQCSATPQPLCSFGACPPGLICTTNATGCACFAPPPPVSGEVPDRLPQVPLRLGKAAGGQITLSWGTSCLSSDTDYAIYDGQVPNYYSHGSLFCTTGGATTMTFLPATGRRYYLVVPHQNSVEGSYGSNSGGAQRPQGAPACLSQAIGACP